MIPGQFSLTYLPLITTQAIAFDESGKEWAGVGPEMSDTGGTM